MASTPMVFPSTGLEVLSSLISFFGLTIITHCISRRVQHEQLTWHGIKTMPWPRLSVILMFCDSWLFLFSSGVLVLGVGLERNINVCIASIYICIVFYSTSKFLMYAYLAEKVHVVWSPTVGDRRFESPIFLVCVVTVSLYCIVITLLFGGPIHELNSDGACVIGLKPISSIPLLVYDLYINVFLTTMFLWPLIRAKLMSSSMRRLAKRTFVAALIGLSISTINIAIIIVMDGRELAWVCLGACGADVIVNAVAVFWVSSGAHYRVHPDITSTGLPQPEGRSTRRRRTSGGAEDLESGKHESELQIPELAFIGSQMHSIPLYAGLDSVHEQSSRAWFGWLFRNGKRSDSENDARIASLSVEYPQENMQPIRVHTQPDNISISESTSTPSHLFEET